MNTVSLVISMVIIILVINETIINRKERNYICD